MGGHRRAAIAKTASVVRSKMISEQLVLDPLIRDWVLIPIVLVMFLVGVLRDRVTRLLRTDMKPKLENIRNTQILSKSRLLRLHSGFIPEERFRMRRKFIVQEYLTKGKEKSPLDAMQMMNDPSMFMDMMKKNMVMMVPQLAMMGWVSYFFSGFIVGKLPFPLTERFKIMLQRGIELSSLDVTYVSSLSLYILTLFGLRGILMIALGPNDDADDTKIMQQQMQGGMNAQAQDMKKIFEGETKQLDLVQWESALNSIESRVMNMAD